MVEAAALIAALSVPCAKAGADRADARISAEAAQEKRDFIGNAPEREEGSFRLRAAPWLLFLRMVHVDSKKTK
jgi:hypothetical protein